jgi:hypothetical protein
MSGFYKPLFLVDRPVSGLFRLLEHVEQLILEGEPLLFQFFHELVRMYLDLCLTTTDLMVEFVILIEQFGEMPVGQFQFMDALPELWQFMNEIVLVT